MPARRLPLNDLINTVQLTDVEIRRIMRGAASEADKILRTLDGQEGITSKVRSAQLSMAKAQAEAWKSVGDATKVGIGDAFDASAEFMSQFDTALFDSVGMNSTFWRHSMLATSRAGIDAFIARTENRMTLSDRVYRNSALSKGYVDRAINQGLILGKTVAEIKKDVIGFIHPDTPGGASYAAQRLARTEVVTAYHEASKARYIESPWVERVKWNLSGAHSRPDECNEYADSVNHRGFQAGQWLPTEVPAKPHPNCLCYVTPEVMDLDTFAKNFNKGKYDAHIDGGMGCTRIA